MDKGQGHRVVITAASRNLIARHAEGNLRVAEPLADGRYAVWFDDDVWECLQAIDSDIDEAIRILCVVGVGHA